MFTPKQSIIIIYELSVTFITYQFLHDVESISRLSTQLVWSSLHTPFHCLNYSEFIIFSVWQAQLPFIAILFQYHPSYILACQYSLRILDFTILYNTIKYFIYSLRIYKVIRQQQHLGILTQRERTDILMMLRCSKENKVGGRMFQFLYMDFEHYFLGLFVNFLLLILSSFFL